METASPSAHNDPLSAGLCSVFVTPTPATSDIHLAYLIPSLPHHMHPRSLQRRFRPRSCGYNGNLRLFQLRLRLTASAPTSDTVP